VITLIALIWPVIFPGIPSAQIRCNVLAFIGIMLAFFPSLRQEFRISLLRGTLYLAIFLLAIRLFIRRKSKTAALLLFALAFTALGINLIWD
jgi:hypothetical protein